MLSNRSKLQHGADINAINNEGRTAVEEAAVKGALVLGKYLTLVKSNPKVGQLVKLKLLLHHSLSIGKNGILQTSVGIRSFLYSFIYN